MTKRREKKTVNRIIDNNIENELDEIFECIDNSLRENKMQSRKNNPPDEAKKIF